MDSTQWGAIVLCDRVSLFFGLLWPIFSLIRFSLTQNHLQTPSPRLMYAADGTIVSLSG